MSTIKDFENAPVGATATSPNGNIAIKTERCALEWSLYDSHGFDAPAILRSDEMVGFTLNPAAPTTAQEALTLAWELASPVKKGQTMPSGTEYLLRHGPGYDIKVSLVALSIDGIDAESIRTLDPLPDPEPDWLDAPAVLAECLNCNEDGLVKSVHVNFIGERWACTECQRTLPWRDLTDVTPLYPKEDA